MSLDLPLVRGHVDRSSLCVNSGPPPPRCAPVDRCTRGRRRFVLLTRLHYPPGAPTLRRPSGDDEPRATEGTASRTSGRAGTPVVAIETSRRVARGCRHQRGRVAATTRPAADCARACGLARHRFCPRWGRLCSWCPADGLRGCERRATAGIPALGPGNHRPRPGSRRARSPGAQRPVAARFRSIIAGCVEAGSRLPASHAGRSSYSRRDAAALRAIVVFVHCALPRSDGEIEARFLQSRRANTCANSDRALVKVLDTRCGSVWYGEDTEAGDATERGRKHRGTMNPRGNCWSAIDRSAPEPAAGWRGPTPPGGRGTRGTPRDHVPYGRPSALSTCPTCRRDSRSVRPSKCATALAQLGVLRAQRAPFHPPLCAAAPPLAHRRGGPPPESTSGVLVAATAAWDHTDRERARHRKPRSNGRRCRCDRRCALRLRVARSAPRRVRRADAGDMALLLDAYEDARRPTRRHDFEDILIYLCGMRNARMLLDVQAVPLFCGGWRVRDVNSSRLPPARPALGGRHDACVVGDVAQTILPSARADYLTGFDASTGARSSS